MSYTIYDEQIWCRILDKRPNLKELAIKAGVENNPEKAREIRGNLNPNFGRGKLSEVEQELAIELMVAEFAEQGFINGVVLKGSFAYSVGANDDALAAFDLVLTDFNIFFSLAVNILGVGSLVLLSLYSSYVESIYIVFGCLLVHVYVI